MCTTQDVTVITTTQIISVLALLSIWMDLGISVMGNTPICPWVYSSFYLSVSLGPVLPQKKQVNGMLEKKEHGEDFFFFLSS